ncbi:hypothetical protein SCUCBS95973_007106 [Sporothrix curviconia]|uniref:DUF7730 domain-containing protein n=1 Tax=Sporothrix curviconia TaxID=1260050 RepID=A0ABP0CD75_9PEZI
MQLRQEKRRRKPAHVSSDPTPDTLECELWHRNADESPLLRLPPELRNRIYGLVLTVGQIHVRYRPWRHRKTAPGNGNTKTTPTSTPASPSSPSPSSSAFSSLSTDAADTCGEFYAVALDVDQDAWSKKACRSYTKTGRKSSTPLPDALTPLAAVCRQLYRETAALPFALNAWSFESARVMERYLVREKRLTLLQRRAMAVLIVSDDLPSRAMEKYLGGLRVVVWKDGKTFQRWELASAAELQRLVESTKQRAATSSSRRGAWHLYE